MYLSTIFTPPRNNKAPVVGEIGQIAEGSNNKLLQL